MALDVNTVIADALAEIESGAAADEVLARFLRKHGLGDELTLSLLAVAAEAVNRRGGPPAC